MDPNKERALGVALGAIEKNYGKGAIMRLGEGGAVPIAVLPTGSVSLDIALGIGGYPRGRIVEIFGPESSGKTTLTLHAIAEAQRQGGVAAFIDAEHALDPTYARKVGVRVDELLLSQPDHGEQALEIADTLVRSGAVDVIVVDSVAALVPKAEIEGEMGDQHVGLHARLMSQALRKLTATVHKSQCTLIFINQIRMKIGVMFGSPETTTGGQALKFYASQRLDIRRVGQIKDRDDEPIGLRARVKVVKNKLAPPFQECEFDILFRKGICRVSDVLDLAAEEGVIEKSGSWYTCDGDRFGQGRDAARQFLEEHPEIVVELERKLYARHGLTRPGDTDAARVEASTSAGGAAQSPASGSARANGHAQAQRARARG
ncbi:MAG: recombinase RecA [Myxococcota bacterium]|nr:recombinase RecA [Myxococcota bacterium]MDW8362324.1 recombinase RecA [Myxococcales bacterium]